MNPAEIGPAGITDIVFIIVLLLSGVLAFLRGFVHEVLTIIAWVGAILAVVFGFPHAQPFALQYIHQPLIAGVATGTALFLVSLIVFSLLTRPIAATVSKTALNGLDRTLGFVFGLLRGFVLVSLGFLVIWFLILGAKTSPSWLKEARTGPFIEYGVKIIYDLIPKEWGTPELNLDGIQFTIDGATAADDAYKALVSPRPRQDPAPSPQQQQQQQPPGSAGYSPTQTQEMNRLMNQANP